MESPRSPSLLCAEKIRSRNKRNGRRKRGKKRTRRRRRRREGAREREEEVAMVMLVVVFKTRETKRGGEDSLGSEIICRYNRLPAGKKVKCEVPFAMRCYVDGVSLLIFNSLPAYLVRSEGSLKCSWLRSEIIFHCFRLCLVASSSPLLFFVRCFSSH